MPKQIVLFRLKAMIWFRQIYMPGMRGALIVIAINLLILVTVKVVTMRMAHIAMQQKRFMAKPVRRRFVHVNIMR